MVATGRVVTAGSGESVSWGDVAGKPSTFPPSTHSHAYADITAKPSTFPPSTHDHPDATRVLLWSGSAYVVAPDADIYVGPGDPGAVPNGSVWIDTDA